MDQEPEWIEVLGMMQSYHKKKGGLPSLKITYSTMLGLVREWVCFEHHSYDVGDNKRYAWDKAVEWHNKRLPDTQVPTSIEDALFIEYPQPLKILVRPNGIYWNIMDYEWGSENTESEKLNEEEYFDIPF